MGNKCRHVGPAGKSWAQAWHPSRGFVYEGDIAGTQVRCLYCGASLPLDWVPPPPSRGRGV